MFEVEVDLRNLQPDDTLWWDDEPLVGDLLVALRACAGQRVKIRVLQHHETPGPNWGHEDSGRQQ